MSDRNERMAKLTRLLGADMVLKASEMQRMPDVVSTGVMSIDLATGIGGIPRKNLTLIYGPEAGGKTSLCYSACASVVKAGGVPVFIDMEKKTSVQWIYKVMGQYGIDPDDVLVLRPEAGDEAIDAMRKAIMEADLVALDSAFHLVTRAQLDSKAEDQHPAALARLIGQNIKQIQVALEKSNCALLWTNQLRHTFDQYNPDVIPGGEVMNYVPMIKLEVRKLKQIREGTDVVGIYCRARTTKNQCAAPFKKANFSIFFDTGIDLLTDVYETGVELDVIKKSGSWFSYRQEEDVGFNIQGAKSTMDHVRENPELFSLIEADVRAAFQEHASQE